MTKDDILFFMKFTEIILSIFVKIILKQYLDVEFDGFLFLKELTHPLSFEFPHLIVLKNL